MLSTKSCRSRTPYLDVHMDSLYWGSYLGSSHSSVSVNTPSRCNDQAILILKICWFSIHSRFDCTKAPLERVHGVFVCVRFSTGLTRHKRFPSQSQQKNTNLSTITLAAFKLSESNVTLLGHPQLTFQQENQGEICGSKKRRKNPKEQSFSCPVPSKTSQPQINTETFVLQPST